ncbi:MAG: hypothetical protein AAF849_13595 [Bacteroidota bacterium]
MHCYSISSKQAGALTMEDMLNDQEKAIEQIRSIILREDRSELQRIRATLENKEELSKRVSPILEERMAFLKQEFPTEFKSIVDELIEEKLKASQQEILDVIYPVVGKLIKKYIQHQFELLRENINRQMERSKTLIFFWDNKANDTNVSPADQILNEIDLSIIHEVYVIQKESGLLLGTLSGSDLLDSDALAGMLTAIKLFVEDAFLQKNQNLETIGYENYQIFVYNSYTYYIAVAIEGSLSKHKFSKLEDTLMNASEDLRDIVRIFDENTTSKTRAVLSAHFLQVS